MIPLSETARFARRPVCLKKTFVSDLLRVFSQQSILFLSRLSIIYLRQSEPAVTLRASVPTHPHCPIQAEQAVNLTTCYPPPPTLPRDTVRTTAGENTTNDANHVQ